MSLVSLWHSNKYDRVVDDCDTQHLQLIEV